MSIISRYHLRMCSDILLLLLLFGEIIIQVLCSNIIPFVVYVIKSECNCVEN